MSSLGSVNVLRSLPSIPTVPATPDQYTANATRFSSGVSETWHGVSQSSVASFVISPMRCPSSANFTIAPFFPSLTAE